MNSIRADQVISPSRSLVDWQLPSSNLPQHHWCLVNKETPFSFLFEQALLILSGKMSSKMDEAALKRITGKGKDVSYAEQILVRQ